VNGATNVAKDKVIIVTFSEDVVMGTGWIELVDSNGTPVDVNMSINGNVLTITPTKALKESKYKLMIHTGSVTDMAGNMVAGKSFSFSVGSSPTITDTSPLDGATNVNVAKTITVTFSEAIRKSSHFWVELVDSTGNAVTFTTYITSGNILVIDPTGDLAAGTTYKVKLHTGCVTDLAGNPVAPYVFSFTTRNT
ncbi:MAG: Ig-like domain-containing protein, partial [Methanothermobacter sp.]